MVFVCRSAATNSDSDDDREVVRLGAEGFVLVIEGHDDDDEEHHDVFFCLFYGDAGCDLDLVERMLVMMLVLLPLLLLLLLLLLLVLLLLLLVVVVV